MSFVPPELSVLEGNPSLDNSVTNSFEGNNIAVTSDNDISESDLDNNYSFSSTSSDESDDIELEEKLSEWATKFSVTHNALRALLKILCQYHTSLPKDPRTLLRTTSHVELQEICGGFYHHFGVETGLKSFLQQMSPELFKQCMTNIEIQINIDGLPLFKSTNEQFWPILGRAVKPFASEPFIIGIFLGDKKPDDINIFLNDFIVELKKLKEAPMLVPNLNTQFQVSVSCMICDTPARAFVNSQKAILVITDAISVAKKVSELQTG